MNFPELFDFQEEAVSHALDHNPDMIIVPTGEGKTIIALKIVDILKLPTIVVVPTIELVKQWEKTIISMGGNCTTYSSGSDREFSDFTVITYASMLKYIDRIGMHYGLVIFDEVHHLFAEEYRKIGNEAISLGLKDIGLTASPRTMGEEELIQNRMFPYRYERTIRQRQNSDRAVDLKFHAIPITLSDNDLSYYKRYWEIYVQSIRTHGGFRQMASSGYEGNNYNEGMVAYSLIKKLLTTNDEKVRKALEIIQSNPNGRFIIFMDTIRMVNALSKFLEKKGIPSVKIHAPKKGFESQNRNQREKIIHDLNEGNARVLIGCNAIEEGLDLPEMDNAIFFSNFSSGSRKIIQRAGRAMRSLPGKEVRIYVLYAKGTKEEENLKSIRNILGVN